MKKHFIQGFSIVLLLTLILFNDAIRAKGTSQVPCRPVPEVCTPEIQSPPCQPSLCPDAATPETPRVPKP